MAITLGTSVTGIVGGVYNGSTFDHTIAFTVPFGTSVLTLRVQGTGAGSPSAFAWNGASMTSRGNTDDGNTRGVRIVDIDAPQSGTYNITFTATQYRTWRYVVTPLFGVSTSAPRGTLVSTNTYTSNSSVTATTEVGGCVLDVLVTDLTVSAGSGQTTEYAGAGEDGGFAGMSSEIATTTSTVMSWTHAAGFRGHLALPYNPATRRNEARIVSVSGAGANTLFTISQNVVGKLIVGSQ